MNLQALGETIFPKRSIMRRGDVVYDTTPEAAKHSAKWHPAERYPSRGIVMVTPGTPLWMDGRMAPNQYIIKRGPGYESVTDNYDGHWQRVPCEDWTPEERITHHCMTYTEPDWMDEGDPVPHDETWEYHLLLSMLPHEVAMETYDGDLMDIGELAKHVVEFYQRPWAEREQELLGQLRQAQSAAVKEVLSTRRELPPPKSEPRLVAP